MSEVQPRQRALAVHLTLPCVAPVLHKPCARYRPELAPPALRRPRYRPEGKARAVSSGGLSRWFVGCLLVCSSFFVPCRAFVLMLTRALSIALHVRYRVSSGGGRVACAASRAARA